MRESDLGVGWGQVGWVKLGSRGQRRGVTFSLRILCSDTRFPTRSVGADWDGERTREDPLLAVIRLAPSAS